MVSETLSFAPLRPEKATGQSWAALPALHPFLLLPLPPSPSDSVDHLVKQLGETFGAEAAAQEPVPSGAACPDEDSARRSSLPAEGPEAVAVVSEEKAEAPPSPGAGPVWPARPAGHGFFSGKCWVGGEARRRLRVPGEMHGPRTSLSAPSRARFRARLLPQTMYVPSQPSSAVSHHLGWLGFVTCPSGNCSFVGLVSVRKSFSW